MLRKFLLLLALLVLVGIGLVWTNVIDLNYNRGAEAPIEVKVNPVEVGTSNATVQVPVVNTETRHVQTPALRVNDGTQPAAAPPPTPAPVANGQ